MTVHFKQIPQSYFVLIALSFLFVFSVIHIPVPVECAQSKQDNPIEKHYNKAKDYYYLLIRDKKIQSNRENWLNGIRDFRRIYLDDPVGEFAPGALFMIAKMHYRMFMRFHKEIDLDESIAYYTEVQLLFPQNSLSDDALFWAAEIYLKDKRNPQQAAKLYAKQIKLYPKGDKYAPAASRLQDIKTKHNVNLPKKYAEAGTTKKLMKVLPVNYWSSDTYTRVVIRSSSPVRYRSKLLEKKGSQSRQLSIDFAQSSIDPKYTAPIPINDGLLQKIRTSQIDSTTVRVTMDIESISTYKIFSLNDPFRVIVDVHGQQKIISASKTLPEVREEQIADRAMPELKPARKRAVEKSAKKPHIADRSVPFIILDDINKQKPGTAARKRKVSDETGLTLAQQLGLRVRRIVIDPGHGGKDPGAMAHGLKEKDITLIVARKTAVKLTGKYNYEVILTRSSDTSLPLEERTAIANTQKADLFVSIHVNAHPSKDVRGVETFYLNLATNSEAMRVAALENATSTHNISDLQDILSDLMKNSKIQESSILARYVQNSLISGLRQNRYKPEDLGVKQAPFYVLIGAEMPAVLAEISFLSNKKEAELLRNEDYLNDIADQIASGVAGYVEHQASAALQL